MNWNGQEITLHARYLGKEKDSFAIELSWSPESLTFAEILHCCREHSAASVY